MDLTAVGMVVAVATGIAAAVVLSLRGIERVVSAYRITRAGPRPLTASRHRIWRHPGDVRELDLATGPGGADGAPAPPFVFLEEHADGSQPCISVRDARDRRWRVKWGHEVRCEAFAVRLVWACGYFAEVTHFVPSGRVTGVEQLGRAGQYLSNDGSFVDARFEIEDVTVTTMFEEHSWAWNDNPFVGTRELNGLKILVMLLSNWDTKDRRDVARGSNTAIFEHRISRWRREARYLVTDWGAAMGRWGGTVVTRGRWDPDGFEAQTPEFVTRIEGDIVHFGYAGQRTADVADGIRVSDVAWLCGYLGAITDRQIAAALEASGATEEEAARFSRALRARIGQLQAAAARRRELAEGTPAGSLAVESPAERRDSHATHAEKLDVMAKGRSP